MEIGRLRNRVTLQKHIHDIDPEGFPIDEWRDVATVWAAVSNLSGREFYAAAAVQAENTVSFIVRYFPGIDTTYKILFRGKQYNIIAIDNIRYENKYLIIKTDIVTGSSN